MSYKTRIIFEDIKTESKPIRIKEAIQDYKTKYKDNIRKREQLEKEHNHKKEQIFNEYHQKLKQLNKQYNTSSEEIKANLHQQLQLHTEDDIKIQGNTATIKIRSCIEPILIQKLNELDYPLLLEAKDDILFITIELWRI